MDISKSAVAGAMAIIAILSAGCSGDQASDIEATPTTGAPDASPTTIETPAAADAGAPPEAGDSGDPASEVPLVRSLVEGIEMADQGDRVVLVDPELALPEEAATWTLRPGDADSVVAPGDVVTIEYAMVGWSSGTVVEETGPESEPLSVPINDDGTVQGGRMCWAGPWWEARPVPESR